MPDDKKTQEELIAELQALRQRLAALEVAEAAHKQNEEMLRENEELFRGIFERSTVGKALTAPDGKLLKVNQTFADLLGYTVAEMEQLNFAQLTHPEDVVESRECIRCLLANERNTYRLEKRYLHKNGRVIWADVSTTLFRDKTGTPRYLITSITDMTARKQIEEQLRQSEYELTLMNKIIKTFLTVSDERMYDEVLQIVLETLASPFGVFGYLDEQGNLVVPTMTRHVWEQCKIADKNIIFPQSAWGESTWPRAIRDKRTIMVNHPSTNIPSGHIPIQRHISMPLLHQNEAIGLLQVANKTTEYHERDMALLQTLANVIAPVLSARIHRNRQEKARRQAEAEQQRLTTELIQKNQELEQIVYVTSHDLRTPLVNVQGFSKELQYSLQEIMMLLQSDQVPKDIRAQVQLILEQEVAEDLEYILTSIARMDTLLSGLLHLSRLGRAALTMEDLDMNDCLANVINTFEFQIKKAGTLVEIAALPSCRGDAVQISQVFSNLVGNALKFLDPARPGVIKFWGKTQENQSIYCIEDNGIGIAPNHQERIFEIFHRLNPTQSAGEGLGLTIVRRILERHHGSIRVESEPGKGSKFYVTLPRS